MEQYCLKDLQDSTSTAGQSGLKMSAHCGGKKDASQRCWRLVDLNVSAAPVCQHKRPSKPDPDPATWTMDKECHQYSSLWNA